MADDDGYRLRSMRIPDPRWAAIDRVATSLGLDRTGLINAVMAWWLREAHAKQPKRPDQYPADSQVS